LIIEVHTFSVHVFYVVVLIVWLQHFRPITERDAESSELCTE